MAPEFLRAGRPVAKVCGITGARDLELAAGAGADLVGLVSWEHSSRHVTDAEVAVLGRVARALGVHAVLVTVDRPRAEVEAVVDAGELAGAQLCGAEDPRDWGDFPGQSRVLLRRVGAGAGALEEVERWRPCVTAFVVDQPGAPGGTGAAVDLGEALAVAHAAPALLAGGLDAARVAGLSSAAAAFVGFDASSRLESGPRTKDARAVADFVSTVHARTSAESLR